MTNRRDYRDLRPAGRGRPLPCPHCFEVPADLGQHVRDTGDALEVPAGSCPVLFAKRNRRALPLAAWGTEAVRIDALERLARQ